MNNMMEFRQSQLERLEDAGVIRHGEHAHSVPKADRGTLRTRILRSVRDVLRGGAR